MDSVIFWGIAGLFFVVLMARKIRSHIKELFFFGGVFGLAEAYRFWGAEILGWSQMPEWLMVFIASGFVFWSILKIMMVLEIFFPPLGIIPRTILGD